MFMNVMTKVQQIFNHQSIDHHLDLKGDFPGVTELEMLTHAKEQLAKVDLLAKRKFKANIQLVLNLDESTYRKVLTVTHHYLTVLKDNAHLRDSIESAVYEYLRQLYTTYTQIIDEAVDQEKVALSIDEINLVLVRYLNVLFLMAKWRYFDDQPAPLGVWHYVYQVVRLAERFSITSKNLFLYDFQNKETSIAAVLERGFMLDTLQTGSYTELQIELAERVLKTWATNPVISKDNEKNTYQFFIQLDSDKRPQRLRGEKGHADFRYWRTARVVDLIETYLCAVDTRKSLDEFNLTTMASAEDIVQLFKKLRVDWCVKGYKRQRRSEQRKSSLAKLTVSHGIENVCARISRGQSNFKATNVNIENASSEFALANEGVLLESFPSELNAFSSETWSMIEESDSGFSVELGREISHWVKTGVLIGYSITGQDDAIAIAEIKTVRKRANGTYRLGLLKISHNATALEVFLLHKTDASNAVQGYEVDDGSDGMAYSAGFLSLLIDEGENKKSKLIVPKRMYKHAHRYKVRIGNSEHLFTAGEVVSKHHGWVCFKAIV